MLTAVRRPRSLIILLLSCWAHAACSSSDEAPPRAANAPLIVSHRGVTTDHPENSFAAVQAAIDVGADGVEVDLQATADGGAVVFHDAELGRLTARQGPVQALTLAELTSIPLITADGGDGAEKIASLDAFLERFAGRCLLFLEMKPPLGPLAQQQRDQFVHAVGEAVRRHGHLDDTLVSSLDRGLIELLARHYPEIRTVYELALTPEAEQLPSSDEGLPTTTWLGADYRWVTAERAAWTHRHYQGLSCYTPNLLEDHAQLTEYGVDLIITDAPRLATLWRDGPLRDPPADAIRTLTSTWPTPGADFPGALQADGALEVELPPNTVLTLSVPAEGGAINFVSLDVERLGEPLGGQDRVAFVVLEEPDRPSPHLGIDAFQEVFARTQAPMHDDKHYPRFYPLRWVPLADGRCELSATFVAQPRTRSVFVAITGSGFHRLRLRNLRSGVITI